MSVAANHDGGALGHPQIALPQRHAVAPRQPDQLHQGAMHQPRIRWMRHRLGLHRGVDDHPLEILT